VLRRTVLAYCVALGALGCARRAAPPPADPAPLIRPDGRYDVTYRIAMPDPASHLFEVSIEVAGVDVDTLDLQLPVWSPGRYARMDFARNVQRFAATAGGDTLRWDKGNGSLWRVATDGAREVQIHYRVFADNLSGTFSVLDTLHANWNGASLFMYVVGHKPDPVKLVVTPPAGWHVINGASLAVDQLEFTFPTYDHFIDTPTEVAPALDVDTMRVDGRLIRVVVHHGDAPIGAGEGRVNGVTNASAEAPRNGLRERFLRDVRRIVETEHRVLGPPPLETYTFLFNVGFPGGDGMEHLTSTQIIDASPWRAADTLLSGIETASHEYFHAWNVKRIRPVALGPFDYTREQYQPSLWVAEGWTQYYGEMTLHRAGIVDKAWLYRTLAGTVRYTSETPARLEMSARMASFHAPFWDGAAAPMATNRPAQFISYYTKGAALALLLDLKIRAASDGRRSLDDVLRVLKTRTWDARTSDYYLPGRGYTEDDVERAASDVMGENLHPWFTRYVGGVEELPWAETLALAGITLTVREGEGGREYELSDTPTATAQQVRVREGWLKGSEE
jgi:predicted metalloprotease with PDZ domain